MQPGMWREYEHMVHLINVNHLVVCVPEDSLSLVDSADLPCCWDSQAFPDQLCWVHLTELISILSAHLSLGFTCSLSKLPTWAKVARKTLRILFESCLVDLYCIPWLAEKQLKIWFAFCEIQSLTFSRDAEAYFSDPPDQWASFEELFVLSHCFFSVLLRRVLL